MTAYKRLVQTFEFIQVPTGTPTAQDVLTALAPIGALEVYDLPGGRFRILIGDTNLGPAPRTTDQPVSPGQWITTTAAPEPGSAPAVRVVDDPAYWGFEPA